MNKMKDKIIKLLEDKKDSLVKEFNEIAEKHGEDLKKLRNDITVYEIMKNEKLALTSMINEIINDIETLGDK